MNYKTIYNKFNFIIKIYILKMNHIKKKIIKAKIYLNQKLMIQKRSFHNTKTIINFYNLN